MMTNFTDVLRVSPMNLNFQQNITNTSGTEFFFI
ncbi:MAG: hypothetical protein H6R24_2331, partial [Proteobacteria bacterium]|nr:hypothetical protein [Pseudomonadota bacterium]